MATGLPTATDAPLHVGDVTLAARDASALARFYETVIGLERLGATPERVELGAGGIRLLVLENRPLAARDAGRAPGLFHTAFLMPSREELGRWLAGALELGIAPTGASNHKVSEAIYLDDPEGNGIEVYADRPRSEWRRSGDEYEMTTERLDVPALLAAGRGLGAPATSAPAGMRIGHIHLRVDDIARAEAFYAGGLGLAVTHRRPGALWFGSGGYHHHVAANTWRSAGSGPRPAGTTGLVEFTLVAKDLATLNDVRHRLARLGVAIEASGDAIRVNDPAGLTIAWKSTA
jgi:catechol 2,3-dioxygenase